MHKMLSLLVTMVIQYPFFICRTPQNQTQYICSMYWLLLIESKYWYLLEFQKDTLNMGTYYLRNLCHQLKNKPSWRRSWFLLLLHLWSRTFSSFLNLWTKFIPNIFHISTAIKQELTQCRWVHCEMSSLWKNLCICWQSESAWRKITWCYMYCVKETGEGETKGKAKMNYMDTCICCYSSNFHFYIKTWMIRK